MNKYKALKLFIEKSQKQGLTVGLSHGAFDLLHYGHLRLIEFAKSKVDILIIGIDSDIMVKRLKGNLRPIMPAKERKVVMESIKFPDKVFIIETNETNLSSFYLKLYKYLGIDQVISGPSPYKDKMERDCKTLNIKYITDFSGIRSSISTTKIIENSILNNAESNLNLHEPRMRNKQIFSEKLIFEMSHELRKQGKTVGFTHGAYDLFHATHLDFLLKSAQLCDFLIVAIDCDENIQRYKDYMRPIIDQTARLEIVNQLNCVDATFVKSTEFFNTSLRDLYKEIKPSFITIGNRFGAEKVIEEECVKGGTKLVRLDPVENYTTTKIIEKIIASHKRKIINEAKLTSEQ